MSPVAGVLRDPQANLPTAPSGEAGSPSKCHLPMLIMLYDVFGRQSVILEGAESTGSLGE